MNIDDVNIFSFGILINYLIFIIFFIKVDKLCKIFEDLF